MNKVKEYFDSVTDGYFSFEAEWSPVYFEPIPNSGERFTAAVVVSAHGTGKTHTNYKVIRSIALHKLQCMYGPDAAIQINDLIEVSLESLELQLSSGASLQECQVPLYGFQLGPIKRAVSNDMKGIVNQALRSSSSLANLDFDSNELIVEENANKRWTTQIREALIQRIPDHKDSFNKTIRLSSTSRKIKFDFAFASYVANFGSIPLSNPSSIQLVRSKILDLENLTLGLLGNEYKLEMVVGLPYPTDATGISSSYKIKMLDSIEQLKHDTGSRHIDCFFTEDPQEAADHIITRVA